MGMIPKDNWEPHTHIVGPGTVDRWQEMVDENAALRSRIEMHEIHINLLETRLKDAGEVMGSFERKIRRAIDIAEDLGFTSKDALHGMYSILRIAQRELAAYRAKYGEVE